MKGFDINSNGSRGEAHGSNNTSSGSWRKVLEDEALLPAVDIQEDETGILLCADMPGVPKEGLAIELEGNVLSLEGEIQLDVPLKIATLYNEVHGRRYARSFTLSKELDTTRIQATLEQGVLKLHFPKAAALRPHSFCSRSHKRDQCPAEMKGKQNNDESQYVWLVSVNDRQNLFSIKTDQINLRRDAYKSR